MLKKLFIVSFLGVILISLVGCGSMNKSSSVVSGDQDSQVASAQLSKAKFHIREKDMNIWASAVAPNGAVYVVAQKYLSNDMLIIKYDPTGTKKWQTKVSSVRGWKIAIGKNTGRIYVLGQTYVPAGTFPKAYVACFNKDGALRWSDEYKRCSGSSVWSMAIDEANNAFYAVGAVRKATAHPDFLIIKYDYLSGRKEWVRLFDAGAKKYDSAESVTVDSFGDIYVAGQGCQDTDQDIITLKYDKTGALMWKAVFGGPRSDGAFQVAVDGTKCVVLGESNTSLTTDSVVLLTYDSMGGNLLWKSSYTTTTSPHHLPSRLIIDRQGDIYVGGVTGIGATPAEIFLLKYKSWGALDWSRTYHATPVLNVDSDMEIYERSAEMMPLSTEIFILGYNGGDSNLLHYDSTGKRLGVDIFSGAAKKTNITGCDLNVDINGNAIISANDGRIGFVYKRKPW